MEHLLRFATWFALKGRLIANALTLAYLLACAGPDGAFAGELRLTVADKLGHGVDDAVVTVMPVVSPPASLIESRAVMDQRNLAFVPRVLVVAAGTSVEFPNSDVVSHQVYSFSAAKKFQLPLYKGELHPPIRFEHEGLVVLGCNIHDEMVGYIYVTAAPYFAKTDANGRVDMTGIPAGDYRITVWNPFIADPTGNLVRTLHIAAADVTIEQFQLVRELRTRPEPRPRRADWEY